MMTKLPAAEADGQGFSLELIDIESDNSTAESCSFRIYKFPWYREWDID